jgi:hypothetical protein
MPDLLVPVIGSRRRKASVALLTPVLAASFLAASGLGLRATTAPWLLLVAVAATLSAAVLASYVPRRGLRPEVGCSPCAAMSALTVVGAAMALGYYGPSLLGPALAVAVTLYGLTQRIGQADTCATPAGPQAPGTGG